MDYYYALLNSYSLLKKRKFKLSIQEQEGPDEGAAQSEAQAYVQKAKGVPKTPGVKVQGGSGKVGIIWETQKEKV